MLIEDQHPPTAYPEGEPDTGESSWEPPQSTRRKTLAAYGSWPAVIAVLAAIVMLATVLFLPVILAVAADAPRSLAFQRVLSSPAAFCLQVLVQEAITVGIVWLLLVRKGITSWRDMGLTREGSGRAVMWGVVTGILFILVSAFISTVLALLFNVEQDQASQFPLLRAGILGKLAIVATVVLVVPVAEEILFRGYVFRAMRARKGLVRAVVYSSLLFGLAHLGSPAAVAPITISAMLLAVSYHRTGHLLTSITAHAFNNAFAMAVVLLTMR